MGGRTIAIGDIHGCSDALATILHAVAPTSDDTIVTLGDYVDRGPDSRKVLDQLIALSATCRVTPLLGNHELLMLAAMRDSYALSFWMQCGGAATLASYGSLEEVPAEHVDFIKSCQRYLETPTHIFLHANYEPRQPMEDQMEEVLFWKHLTQVPEPHRSGKVVIVGHTPQVDGLILDLGHVICIDTYCFGSGYLTALDVDSGECWQADKFGQLNTE